MTPDPRDFTATEWLDVQAAAALGPAPAWPAPDAPVRQRRYFDPDEIGVTTSDDRGRW